MDCGTSRDRVLPVLQNNKNIINISLLIKHNKSYYSDASIILCSQSENNILFSGNVLADCLMTCNLWHEENQNIKQLMLTHSLKTSLASLALKFFSKKKKKSLKNNSGLLSSHTVHHRSGATGFQLGSFYKFGRFSPLQWKLYEFRLNTLRLRLLGWKQAKQYHQ